LNEYKNEKKGKIEIIDLKTKQKCLKTNEENINAIIVK
jgi:hypothetical protein